MVGVAGSEVRTLGIGPDWRKIRQDFIPSLRKPIDFSPSGCKLSTELRHLGE
jgi:hypothetical protein